MAGHISDWSITIINDVAFLYGTDEDNRDIREQKINNIVFEDAVAEYDEELNEVFASSPGFIVTTDFGVYWCPSHEADKYTVHDTATSLSRIVSDDIIVLLTDEYEREKRIQKIINEYKEVYNIEDDDTKADLSKEVLKSIEVLGHSPVS